MKKLIAAIVIASMGASFAADYLVYDYKASIKRVDIQLKKRKVQKAEVVTEKLNVVSDTIQGYVILPRCRVCLEKDAPNERIGIEYTDEEDDMAFNGYAYLTLKGNKFAKDTKKHPNQLVIKTPVLAQAAVFGSETYLSEIDGSPKPGNPINPSQNTKAWMSLDYSLWSDAVRDLAPSELVNIKDDAKSIFLGFLGAANSDGGDVSSTGFGTAKVVTSKTAASATLCGGLTPGAEYNCTIVNTISGTLVGYPEYTFPCDADPMWDVCTKNDWEQSNDGKWTKKGLQYKGRENAVISGTWSLKYNAKLSEVADNQKQAEILKKLGATSAAYQVDWFGKKLQKVNDVIYTPVETSAE